MDKNFELLKRIAQTMKMDVSRETFDQFCVYKDLLKEWNEKINLTAIIEDDEIFLKHFADSISIFRLSEVQRAKTVIDVGTGAGFPGLPMKIIKPDLELTLLDPLNKRLTFLREVANQLGLYRIEFIHGRAEDVSRETSHRDHYDLAVSRAVAVLPTLMEYCLPFVRVEGYFVAMKGPGIDAELALNSKLSEELSARFIAVEPVTDLDDFEHNLVVYRKMKKTERKYPRNNLQIKKDTERYRAKLS